ncbi:unnamed protein product [Fraxinus pennsylvanica]|uniref:SAP domain-containing protein n=1 Tax=Fraxinus pennsylvanica TaxID=56036 RepID=A0AAD2DQ23_9LAMI|nr:unnamed protein product [Fraxinus pennsylvanica]
MEMAKTPTSESNFKRYATKKELQDLCREHDLSPYKTKADLLKSLRPNYKKINLNLFSEVESSNGCSKSLLTELLSGAQLSEATKVNKGVEGRKGKFTSSFVHGHRIYSHSREKDDQEIHSQIVKTNEVGNLKEAGVHDKVSEFKNVEKVGCSTSNIQKHSNSKKQENTCSQNLTQCDVYNLRPRKSHQISAGMNNFFPAEKDSVGSIAGSQHIDSTSTMDGAIPLESSTSVSSLEFCVRSEEGINLFVDLSSSLPDWSKRLENEVRIFQDLQMDKFQRFRQELMGSFMGNVDAGFRISSYCAHTDPSLDSFARKNSKSRIEHPDADDGLSSNMMTKPCVVSVEMSMHLQDKNKVLRLPRLNAYIQNVPLPGIKSCTGNGETETKELNVFHTSPIKLRGNCVSMVSNGLVSTPENHNTKLGRVKCHEDLKKSYRPDNCTVPSSISTASGAVEMQLSGIAMLRQNASYSTVVNDDSLGFVAVDVAETGNIGLANAIEVHHNASLDYVPTTADESKGGGPDGSKASQISKKRLEDCVSGRDLVRMFSLEDQCDWFPSEFMRCIVIFKVSGACAMKNFSCCSPDCLKYISWLHRGFTFLLDAAFRDFINSQDYN